MLYGPQIERLKKDSKELKHYIKRLEKEYPDVYKLIKEVGANDLFNYSSYPVDLNSIELLNNIHLVINSINREEIGFTKFYSILQVYYNELYAIKNGIYLYSFGSLPSLPSSARE